MIPRSHIPQKADEEDIGAIIIALMGFVAIGFIVVAVAVIVALIVLVVVGAAPTVGGIYWLSYLNKRYELTDKVVTKSAITGILLFLAPLVYLALASPPEWRQNENAAVYALWLGTLLGFGGAGLCICFEAYRQAIWPYHKQMLGEQRAALALRARLWRTRWEIGRLQKALARQEELHEHTLRERKRLETLVESLIFQQDVGFYSMERLRWQRECAGMSVSEIEGRLDELNTKIALTPPAEPKCITLTLEAAVCRLEAQNRTFGVLGHETYEEAYRALENQQDYRSKIERELDVIQEHLQAKTRIIQQFKHQRTIVN